MVINLGKIILVLQLFVIASNRFCFAILDIRYIVMILVFVKEFEALDKHYVCISMRLSINMEFQVSKSRRLSGNVKKMIINTYFSENTLIETKRPIFLRMTC